MRAEVNNCRLFVDVVGSQFVADGTRMRQRPVIVMLHGGPGFDHASMKPDFNPLANIAQLIYYDHRGQGRNGRSDPSHWHLDQWADVLTARYDLPSQLAVGRKDAVVPREVSPWPG